jgi:hypothetical protein
MGIERDEAMRMQAGTEAMIAMRREAPRLPTGRLTPPVQVDEAGVAPGPRNGWPEYGDRRSGHFHQEVFDAV